MWDLFFVSVLAGYALLCIPGYVLMRVFSVSRIVCAAAAPTVTVSAYCLLAIVYGKVGIACSWITLALPVLLLGAVVFTAFRLMGRTKSFDYEMGCARVESGSLLIRYRDWILLGLYVLVGVVVVSSVFALSFGSATSFVQEYDNVHHLNSIRAFVDSGIWSSLTSTAYPANVTDFQAPLPGSLFYPSGWHCVAALLVDALGVPVALAANAANFLFSACVFPMGVFLLLRKIFSSKPQVVFFGAFCTLAFIAFPWRLLAWGPLYPNLAAFSLLPTVAFFFVAVFSAGASRRVRVASVILFVVGLMGLVLAQTNAVFTMGVLLIPFCIDRILYACGAESLRTRFPFRLGGIASCVMFVALVCALWVALYSAPFMRAVVSFSWPASTDFWPALGNVLSLATGETADQAALGVLVLVGFVYALVRREYRWVAAAYALMCSLYMVSTVLDGPIKQLLTGFWYTDGLRLGANMALVGIPLASLGLYGIAFFLQREIGLVARRPMVRKAVAYIPLTLVAALFVWVNFYPAYDMSGRRWSPFTEENNFMGTAYGSQGAKVYGFDEMGFVEKVVEVVGPDALILNEPNDGSAFAYGLDDLNVYYRYVSGYGVPEESEASKIIRRSLDVAALDPRVAQAVKSTGAEYLVKLDCDGRTEYSRFLFSYEEREWFGVDRVTDDTPGFEVVLSEGDMRLYRIVLPDTLA